MNDNLLLEKIKKHFDKNAINFLIKNNILKTCLRELILNEELKVISVNSEMRDDAYKSFLVKNKLKSMSDLDKFKQINNLSDENIEFSILKPIKIKLLASNLFKNQAQSRYLKRKDDLTLLIYSIIRTKNKELALELFLRIDSKEDEFSYIASKYSEGTEKITNGLVGPVYSNQINPILKNKLKSLSKGELLEPFKLDEWWVILKLENQVVSDFSNAIQQQMCLELLEEYLSMKNDQYISTLNNYILGY